MFIFGEAASPPQTAYSKACSSRRTFTTPAKQDAARAPDRIVRVDGEQLANPQQHGLLPDAQQRRLLYERGGLSKCEAPVAANGYADQCANAVAVQLWGADSDCGGNGWKCDRQQLACTPPASIVSSDGG